MTVIDIAQARQMAEAAVGRRTWGTALGVGSFLTIELGSVVAATSPGGKAHGEYQLWVYCSAWRIQSKDAVLASSEDPRDFLKKAVVALDGQLLSAVSIDYPSLSTVFEFEGGLTLATFSIFSKDYEHWMLYCPDKLVLTAGPASEITTSS
ncbi:MAG: hypothetical protein ACRCSP_00530 [Rhodoglobus sp.]